MKIYYYEPTNLELQLKKLTYFLTQQKPKLKKKHLTVFNRIKIASNYSQFLNFFLAQKLSGIIVTSKNY